MYECLELHDTWTSRLSLAFFYFPDAFQVEGFIDPSVRSMEIAIVPAIWSLGCDLLICLAIRYVAIKKLYTYPTSSTVD